MYTALIVAFLVASGVQKALAEPSIQVVEGRFVATGSDGTQLPQERLIGVEISIGDPPAEGYQARINDIVSDPVGGKEPLTLYDVSFFNASANAWEPLCNAGPHGLALAVPMSGFWSANGRYIPLTGGRFSFSCTSGAHLKCLRMGYAPWKTSANGESLARFHQACTRMMRADYCGNGKSFTKAGRQIQVFDRRGPDPKNLHGAFEALWGVDGAVCLRRSRVPDEFPIETVLQSCPRLSATVDGCTEAQIRTAPEALLGNRS